MKNKKLIISLSIILVAIIAVFAAVVIATKPATVQGAKEITVTVVSKDKSSKVIDIDTDAEFLGDALYEEKIVNNSIKSRFIFLFVNDFFLI